MKKHLSILRTISLTCAVAGGLVAVSLPYKSAFAAKGSAPATTPQPATESDSSLKLQSLRGMTPPDPSGTEGGRKVDLMTDYVQNRAAAIQLGKALFWDMNIGSDGQTACASCHFHAGVDHRITNQLNPGGNNTDANVASLFNKPFAASNIPGDVASYTTRSGGKGGPNYMLKKTDFPTHVLADPLDHNSAILYSSDDVTGSQGVFNAKFIKASPSRFDDCTQLLDGNFHVGAMNVRRTTGRNAPSVINAAFNFRNFWDGRANNVFNGFSPFGNRDPDAGIFVTNDASGVAAKVRLALDNASAASQSVGPPGNGTEMSCGGRTFADIGRRMLDRQMLAQQKIAPTDSVLSAFSGASRPTYRDMVQKVFQPRLWNAKQQVSLGGTPYSQMEANFPLYFGLAIQMYESTLVSDKAPLDDYLNGNRQALNDQQVKGMNIFTGKGQCVKCHAGPELTTAASLSRRLPGALIDRIEMADNLTTLHDSGFFNVGVRPTSEDLGNGGTDPFGNQLSFTRQYNTVLQGGKVPDPFIVDVCTFEVPLSPAIPCDSTLKPKVGFRDSVDGSFKIPTLRNVALTGPYFHNGSRATLQQVVEFYNRGGDQRGRDANNTTGFDHPSVNQHNTSNLAPRIKPLSLSSSDIDALVKFLEVGLTDPRVAWERAPFDHPELVVLQGAVGDENSVTPQAADTSSTQRAADAQVVIKPVGAEGRTVSQGPLLPFNNDLP
ncbi:cytochrome-c peroxidase [Pseudomonas sp. PCH199]|uniref:cytochrome-c peroxidase n=1 Tax=unclassified Pseudomonas TaxID=196821 RepID=UPI000BCFFA7C|nr:MULTISPECIES: cytochrome c peroxidase [unclassified Pseudomonas]MCW8276495.1 cytochrome-c peroxidase [Pseudomonas sp. PCH199]PAM83287.1 cytochrome-c peroxidase [Pseudomonas sp. ERMR1:02]